MFPRTFAPVRCLFAVCVIAFAPVWAAAADKLPTKYPLPKSPLKMLDELAAAAPALGKPSADERKLLNSVWEQKARAGSGATAALSDGDQVALFLVASGVTSPDAREKYRSRLERLRAECEDAFERKAEPGEFGSELFDPEKLLNVKKLMTVIDPDARGRVVFDRVRAACPKGYEADQTRVSAAFDTGKYNCVSVSALIYLVGTRHGLDLRPMVVSGTNTEAGHAYLELVSGPGGERSVIEGTQKEGYKGVDNLSAEERRLNKRNLKVYARGRETDAAGLAGQIYYNRGVVALRAGSPDFPAAVRLNLEALALDPACDTAVQNLQAALHNWGLGLIKAGEYERAEKVLAVAVDAFPEDADLWWLYAGAGFCRGDDRAVVARVREAGGFVTDARLATPAAFYVRMSDLAVARRDYQEGLNDLARGLKVVPAEQKPQLTARRAELLRKFAADLATLGRRLPMPAPFGAISGW